MYGGNSVGVSRIGVFSIVTAMCGGNSVGVNRVRVFNSYSHAVEHNGNRVGRVSLGSAISLSKLWQYRVEMKVNVFVRYQIVISKALLQNL